MPTCSHDHEHGFRWRSLAVGLMHGMAGSAALLGLAVSAVADPIQGVAYVVLFGLGSMLGMGALSSVIAVPLLSDPIRYDIPKCRGPGRLANGRGFSALGSICVLCMG